MLNQALKTIDLQLFAEPGEELSLFEEPTADDNIPGTTQAETENAAVTKADSPSLPKENGQPIRIKYNGSEMELSRDEAVTLAQKGMNYDKLTERLRSFENSEEFKVLDAYAKQNGVTRQQYVKQLQARQAESLVESEMREIKTRYPEITDPIAKELAEIKAAEKRREFEENEKQEAERLKQDQLRPWQEFSKAYPEIRDVRTLPQGVLDDIASGAEPVSAMRKHELTEAKKEIEKLKQQLQINEKNSMNREKAIGSAASSASEDPADAFLLGFNSL